jgi:hypothetical protein
MTDTSVTVAPLSVVSAHFGYFQNVNQGPTTSTLHVGAEALLTQYWRNSTDVWNGGITWKPLRGTTVGFDEFITHYKGNTHWALTGLNYQLSNGTPVSLGIDLSSVWNSPCASPFTADGTVNPTCRGFLSYTRYAPVRTLFPSEQLHFQGTSIPHFTMNGRVLHISTTSHLTNFNWVFNGLDSRVKNRVEAVTGSANARRIDVSADYGATWQLTPKIAHHRVLLRKLFAVVQVEVETNSGQGGRYQERTDRSQQAESFFLPATDVNTLVTSNTAKLYLLSGVSINSRKEITGLAVDGAGAFHGYLAIPKYD